MQLLGLTFILYVNNKLMHIRTKRGPLFQGSFPFGNRTLQTRSEGAFPFKVSEGREKTMEKNKIVKCKQTNKEIKQNKYNFRKEF